MAASSEMLSGRSNKEYTKEAQAVAEGGDAVADTPTRITVGHSVGGNDPGRRPVRASDT